MYKFMMILALVFSNSIYASATNLEKAEAYTRGSEILAEFNFDQVVSAENAKIEFINETIQVDLKNASIPQGKFSQKIQDKKATSLFVYQAEPEILRARIIFKKDVQASQYQNHVSIEANGSKLVVKVADPATAKAAAAETKSDLKLAPPLDLNAALEPKMTVSDTPAPISAASILETELLSASSNASAETDSAAALPQSQSSEKENLKESEIPLKLDAGKKESSQESPWFRMFMSLGVVSVVGLVAIVLAKRYAKVKTPGASKIKIQVVSQQSLGPKKNLMVVRVAGEDILIGVTDHNISMIKSLSLIDDEFEAQVPRNFVDELNQVTDRYVSSKVATRSDLTNRNKASNEEDFNMGKIKDMVASKLKEMRPL